MTSTAETLQSWIRTIITKYNPDNLKNVEDLFMKWKGKEMQMYEKLCKKYELALGIGAPPGRAFHEEKKRYESLVAQGNCVKLIPREWQGVSPADSSALARAGAPKRAPCDHNGGATDYLDQPLGRGAEGDAITVAVDGPSSRCLLFTVNNE